MIILVNGATAGFGESITRRFIENGHKVIATGRRQERLQELKDELGDNLFTAQVDVRNRAAIEEMLANLPAEWKEIDVLVNNAGIWLSGYVTEISPQDWDLVMNVNLKAIFHLSQLFVNHCLQHDQMGSILNITSQAAFHGSTTGHAHYAASKAGLVAFAISLAREVAKQKINVNNIAVGIMDTAMIRKNIEQNPDYYVSRIPVGRVAQPQEIADIGVFMVSPKTSYMTGATLDVTGGMLMR